MNGVRNALFLLFLFVILIAVEYIYTIGDNIADNVKKTVDGIEGNNITDGGYNQYGAVRSIMYSGITGVLAPFLIFLTFMSSFINRNQSIEIYFIAALVVIIATPVSIYIFSEVFTNLTNLSVLDTAYLAQNYFDNFLYIMVANLLLTLASFVFVKQKGVGQ